MKLRLFSLFLLLICSSRLQAQLPEVDILPDSGDPPFLVYERSPWVDSVLKHMDLGEKIAQLFLVRAYSNRGSRYEEDLAHLIRRYKPGGLLFFQGGPVRQLELTRLYQGLSEIPLLIAQDGEWGPGMRLDSTLSYPRQMMLGAVKDDSLLYRMGIDVARQFRRLGVQVNFAPVVDINNNPLNPVINSRSFGEDRWNVARKGLAYALGMQEEKVLPTAKHFPGHGDTGSDSHHTLPLIPHSRERLDSLELFPYRYMIPRALGGIMVAHLDVPALDPTPGQVSTLSKAIVTGLLREQLGFRGLIVTDALDMAGFTQAGEPGYLELEALQAGNDILLIPEDIPRAIQIIRRAVRRGEISEEEIEQHVRKILAVKYWTGLADCTVPPADSLLEDLHRPAYVALQRDLVASAITLLQNRDSLLPIRHLEQMDIASLSIGDGQPTFFQKRMEDYTGLSHFSIARDASPQDFAVLLEKLRNYDLVLVGIHQSNEIPARKFGISAQTISFVDSLVKAVPTVVDLFANPYSLAYFSCLADAKAVIMSYEDTEISQDYSAQLIFGGIAARGRLPVTAGASYQAGMGVDTRAVRLGFGLPEQEGMDSGILSGIDSLVRQAIAARATPGCQVLVARHGKVVYRRAFGYHTYQNRQPVVNENLYDLASITKIAATLPALMALYDEGKISLESPLRTYLPALDSTNKGDLVLIDILTHQARLNGWVPFYRYTLEPLDTSMALYARNQSDAYPFRLDNHLYLNRDFAFKKGIFQSQFSMNYPIQVAENLFLNRTYRDSLYAMIARSPLREKKEYRYSDLGFYWFQQVVEKLSGQPLEGYVSNRFYAPLGASRLVYKPLLWFPRESIVPTENDIVFRKQLLRGYVHDPGAAMLGGIAGHAGLFSNALDLAKLMQMYLNGGSYGGSRFLQASTIERFSAAPFREEGNRRGIGFDKPETDPEKEGPTCPEASPDSYGHTGFTGTMTWVDPDVDLVYVFLSNRVHPDQENNRLIEMNIRTEIQSRIYRSMGIFPDPSRLPEKGK